MSAEASRARKLVTDYISAVYSIQAPEPNPPLPVTFMAQLPWPNAKVIEQIPTMSNKELVSELKMSLKDRFPALSIIKEIKTSIMASEANQAFVGIFILQSICEPFLETLRVFDAESLRMLSSLLNLTRKMIPQHVNYCFDAFSFVYTKAINSPKFFDMLPDIMKYFGKLELTRSSIIPSHLTAIPILKKSASY